jgi:hypothetical protein
VLAAAANDPAQAARNARLATITPQAVNDAQWSGTPSDRQGPVLLKALLGNPLGSKSARIAEGIFADLAEMAQQRPMGEQAHQAHSLSYAPENAFV